MNRISGRHRFFILCCGGLGLLVPLFAFSLTAVGQGKKEGAKKEAGGKKKEKEKDGGNIIFYMAKPTKEVKDDVLFSHDLHLAKGADCKDCHNGEPKAFKEEKKLNINKVTMKDINAGSSCGVCHNGIAKDKKGKVTFAPAKNCGRCHNVKLRAKE